MFHHTFINGHIDFSESPRELTGKLPPKEARFYHGATPECLQTATEYYFFLFYNMLYGSEAPCDHLAAIRGMFRRMNYLGESVTFTIEGEELSLNNLFLYDAARYYDDAPKVWHEVHGRRFRNINVLEYVQEHTPKDLRQSYPVRRVMAGDPAVPVSPEVFVSVPVD